MRNLNELFGQPVYIQGFPEGTSGLKKKKKPACQCRRCEKHEFDPWVRKIPWSRKWQSTPAFLPGGFHG